MAATYLPTLKQLQYLGALKDQEINTAKKVLAYEVTQLVHGKEEADKEQQAAEALFGGAGALDNVPTVNISREMIGSKLVDVLAVTGIFVSKSEGRRLIQGGGLYVADVKVADPEAVLGADVFEGDSVLIRKGKKSYHRLVLE